MTVERHPVSVIVERRPGTSPWSDGVVRIDGVVPGARPEAPWTVLHQGGGVTRYLAGTTAVVVHPGDTANYRDNLQAPSPALYVVLRKGGGPLGWDLLLVTADPAEAQAHAECGDDLLEAVAMPASLRAALERFVALHHVERPRLKRRRDTAVPETLATEENRR